MRRPGPAAALAAVLLALLLDLPAAAGPRVKAPMTDVILLVDNSGSMKALELEPVYAFIDTLETCCRVGVVGFGEEARVLQDLSPVLTGREKKSVKAALGSLTFGDDFADVQAGLSSALSEFGSRSSEQATKIVILLSDGRIDKPFGSVRMDALLGSVKQGVLADYFLYGIVVYAVAVGDPDLEFLQEISHACAGWCLSAPNRTALDDALTTLSTVLETLQPAPADPGSAAKEARAAAAPAPPGSARLPAAFWILLAALLAVSGMAVALVLAVFRRLKAAQAGAGPERPEKDGSATLAQMRYRIDAISRTMRDAGQDLANFQVDLVTYGAERWERERNFLERYHHLTEHLFLMLDHLEVQVKETAVSEGSELLYRKAHRILQEEGIEEIPVKKGDAFDNKFHKHVGERPGSAPQGAILEVARKGYYIRDELAGEDEFVLRPAEVVVSSGPDVGPGAPTGQNKTM